MIVRQRSVSMSIPKRLIIEYNDGSTKAIPFRNVDRQVQFELAKSELCPAPDEVRSSKQYLLLQWQDEWQEIVSVDSEVTELLRYYVIERVETRGRLALEVGTDYPELFIIERRPRELSHVLIVGRNGSVKSYQLVSEIEKQEGSFDEGGKKEYVKFDKSDSHYPGKFSEEHEALAKVMKRAKKELDRKQLNPEQVLAMDKSNRVKTYKEVAKGMGIRAKERQEDVYGFIELIVKFLANQQS
jgi:ribosome-associated translation inhibitor RaiA